MNSTQALQFLLLNEFLKTEVILYFRLMMSNEHWKFLGQPSHAIQHLLTLRVTGEEVDPRWTQTTDPPVQNLAPVLIPHNRTSSVPPKTRPNCELAKRIGKKACKTNHP